MTDVLRGIAGAEGVPRYAEIIGLTSEKEEEPEETAEDIIARITDNMTNM